MTRALVEIPGVVPFGAEMTLELILWATDAFVFQPLSNETPRPLARPRGNRIMIKRIQP
jgi:hypothetical protein